MDWGFGLDVHRAGRVVLHPPGEFHRLEGGIEFRMSAAGLRLLLVEGVEKFVFAFSGGGIERSLDVADFPAGRSGLPGWPSTVPWWAGGRKADP